MRIGPDRWYWVSIDSVGVPTGGKYGQPRLLAEMIEPLGLKLAWSWLHKCFTLYEVRPDQRILDHFHFRRPDDRTTIPVTPFWFEVFRFMRERWGSAEMRKAIPMQAAKEDYEARLEQEAEMEAMRGPVMDGVELDMGLRTPKAQIIVPGMAWSN